MGEILTIRDKKIYWFFVSKVDVD